MVFYGGKKTFLRKKLFFPPYPYLSKTLKIGFYFSPNNAQCSHKPQLESFRPPFSKGGSVKGEEPLSPVATGEILLILPKTQERVNFFATQRKRENPRRGFSLFVDFLLCAWWQGNFF